jgi:hypothetical protein
VKTAFWLLSQVSWVDDKQLRRMQAAYSLSLGACADDYGLERPSVQVASRAGDIPDTGVPMVFSKSIDQPGDLAYHTFLDGRPYSIVLADPEQVSMADVEEAGNHEGKEILGDPNVDQYVFLPNGDRLAHENCDPGQNQRIPLDLGEGEPVQTSNHVTRAWFDPMSPPGTRFDAAGLISAPLLVGPDGYAMLLSSSGNVKMHGPGLITYDAMGMRHANRIGTPISRPGNFGPPAFKRHPAFRHGKRLAHMYTMAAKIRAGVPV